MKFLRLQALSDLFDRYAAMPLCSAVPGLYAISLTLPPVLSMSLRSSPHSLNWLKHRCIRRHAGRCAVL
ncbi:hypothetical protein SBC1_37610 (plasmid) [Caballeronia sp. SBC1]|nr:hypothetical protein SBC2_50330 [Caballeronia sp. SBC2]QIN63721.1 hypothetical protein SBC1_37610 [Caballeronia sp. SBC1]